MANPDFISEYFIKPIWSHSGYNPVNTAVYAVLALSAAYLIYSHFKKSRIKIDANFILSIIPFVLLGSTVRVITDSIDTGVMQKYVSGNAGSFFAGIYSAILNSHIYDYPTESGNLFSYFMTSPGIWILTAAIVFASMLICHYSNRWKLLPYFGLALWFPHLLLLIPMSRNYSLFLLIILLAILATYLSSLILKRYKISGAAPLAVVFSHALDGAATFTVIDVASKVLGTNYGEQHVVSRFIGEIFASTGYGFFLFFLVKVALASAFAYLISTEKDADDQQKTFLFLILIIIGLAPGVRDALRLLTGA